MAAGNVKRNFAIGCLTIAGIFVAIVIIVVLVFMFRGDAIMRQVFEQAKEGTAFMLTEDHTEQQKQQFMQVFAEFIDTVEAGGMKHMAERLNAHKAAVRDLQQMIADRRITVQESQAWIALYQQGQ